MTTNERIRIDLTDDQHETDAASEQSVSPLGRNTTELEHRITPLVVIAIIAVLIGLLLPAVQSVRG